MTAESRQQHRSLEHKKSSLSEQLQAQIQSPEMYEEGTELDNEKAARMQMHSGNEAIQDLLDQINHIDAALSELELEGMEEDFEEDVELDIEHGTISKGGEDDGGASDDDPWAQDFFFGGDDDPIMIKRKRRKRKRITEFVDSKESTADRSPIPPTPPYIEGILPVPTQGTREGDARYFAVELGLRSINTLIGHSLKPEDLQFRKGIDDPVRLPIELGRFLESEATNELAASWGSILGAPDPTLLSPQGGFSTAVGRLATLGVCAEVIQGVPEVVDTAVQLALHHNVWDHCKEVARQLANRGELHAPKIAQEVLQMETLPDFKGSLPKPNLLGGLALRTLLPAEMAFLRPMLFEPPTPTVESDEFLAQLDMVLSNFAGGDPFAPPESPLVTSEMIQPALQSTNQLLNALGRTQVEAATASVAVNRVNPNAPILSILEHCDDVLRKVARRAIHTGQQLEQLVGERKFQVQNQLLECIHSIEECHQTLTALQRWALMTFAASVQIDSKEVQ